MLKRLVLLIFFIFASPVLAQEVVLVYSVSELGTDPATIEVSLQIENFHPGEIWNVDVRLESGSLGLCPEVFQLGRIPVDGMGRIDSTCVALQAEPADAPVWRIDFDSETGHQRVVTTGFQAPESAQGGE